MYVEFGISLNGGVHVQVSRNTVIHATKLTFARPGQQRLSSTKTTLFAIQLCPRQALYTTPVTQWRSSHGHSVSWHPQTTSCISLQSTHFTRTNGKILRSLCFLASPTNPATYSSKILRSLGFLASSMNLLRRASYTFLQSTNSAYTNGKNLRSLCFLASSTGPPTYLFNLPIPPEPMARSHGRSVSWHPSMNLLHSHNNLHILPESERQGSWAKLESSRVQP